MERRVIQIQDLSVDELLEAIKVNVRQEINSLKGELSLPQNDNEELLNRSEVCELLRISEPTLWQWGKEGRIKCHKIASRNYYKKSDVMAALQLKKQQ